MPKRLRTLPVVFTGEAGRFWTSCGPGRARLRIAQSSFSKHRFSFLMKSSKNVGATNRHGAVAAITLEDAGCSLVTSLSLRLIVSMFLPIPATDRR